LFVTTTLTPSDTATACAAQERPGCACGAGDDPAARQARVLRRLGELGLSLAEAAHARALAAETSDELAGLTLAFHRISRSVRQTLALELKVERARRDAEREDARGEAERAVARHRLHKDRVRAGVQRLIWAETEDEDEADELIEDLEGRLGDQAIRDGFEDTPVETLIARIQADLGLDAGEPGDGTPDEGDDDAGDDETDDGADDEDDPLEPGPVGRAAGQPFRGEAPNST
jgi:hypothetical protein